MNRRATLLGLLVASACAGPPGPSLLPPAPPVADNDPAFVFEGVRRWCLIGNDLTEGHDRLEVVVAAPASTRRVDLWLDGGAGVRLQRDGNLFRLPVDLSSIGSGEHELLFAADGSDQAFARLSFLRTHPYYVVATTDWDNADNPDENLERHVELHQSHPDLTITHFLGPYTFTDPEVSPERAEQLAAWARGMRDTYGDEIGVHIHPRRSFVEAAGVPFRSEPSIARPDGDPTGYTVVLDSYTEDEQTRLFEKATELFEAHGLGTPTSFRAGAWTAGSKTLRAMARAGYVADTSALNWARIEEWEGSRGTTLYDWTRTHWAGIDDQSQPYYPNQQDILSDLEPQVAVLEVPDNGALVDYVTAEEMIEVFHKNWPGGPLDEPRVLSIGWHPPNFGERFMARIHGALVEVDRYLASQDAGPVVYANLSDLVRVWTFPDEAP